MKMTGCAFSILPVYKSDVRTHPSATLNAEANALCIHCVKSEGSTDDHIFPSSWYPTSTPSTVQRLTAPCCPDCNGEFGKLEKDLLIRLVLALDTSSDAARGLDERVFRSLGIGVANLPVRSPRASHPYCARPASHARFRLGDAPPSQTFNLNKAVKRNREHFPEHFMFRLTKEEAANLRFQNGTRSWGGPAYAPLCLHKTRRRDVIRRFEMRPSRADEHRGSAGVRAPARDAGCQ